MNSSDYHISMKLKRKFINLRNIQLNFYLIYCKNNFVLDLQMIEMIAKDLFHTFDNNTNKTNPKISKYSRKIFPNMITYIFTKRNSIKIKWILPRIKNKIFSIIMHDHPCIKWDQIHVDRQSSDFNIHWRWWRQWRKISHWYRQFQLIKIVRKSLWGNE